MLTEKDVEKLIDAKISGKVRFLPKRAKTSMSKKSKRQAALVNPEERHIAPMKVDLKTIKPLTDNQKAVFEYFDQNKNLLLHGIAGTGKTFIALYLALKAQQASKFKKIAIFRSVVSSRDIGFLPGAVEEKIKQYEAPYRDICYELYGRGDAYDILIKKGVLEFISTSYLRGLTFRNTLMLVDEIENCNFQECDTIITRAGDGSRVVLCGDYHQSDLLREKEREGLGKFMRIVDQIKSFEHVEFSKEDIVRSGLVREYIIAREEYNSTHHD